MNLNSINIPYILKRLSCCISNFGSSMYKSSQLGDEICFEKSRDKILILNSLHKILNKYTTISYPVYEYFIITPINPLVCVATITDLTTGTILATGYNSGIVTIPTSLYALQQMLTNLQTSYPCYTYDYTFTKTLTNPSGAGTHIGSYYYSNIDIKITNTCSCTSNLAIHLYQPVVDSPPYTGIEVNTVYADYGTVNLINNFTPGNCTNKVCFTADELNTLYQQSLNICKDCNCN